MALKNSMSETGPFGQLILLGVLMLVGVSFALIVLFGLNLTFFDLPIGQISVIDMRTNADALMAAKTLQIASQIGLFIIPTLVFAYMTSTNVWQALSITSPLKFRTALIGVVTALLAIPFINLLAQWNASWHLPDFLQNVEEWMRNMQTSNDQLMEVILVMKTTPDIIINIVMMAILPAIGEELIFRGVIQKQLVKWLSNPHVAIFITSVFFSAFHMQFLGFLSRLILGMVFGYLFYYSKSIRLPILAHFANNFLALMLAFYFGTDTSDQAFEDPYNIPIIAFSIIGILGSIYLIWVNKNKLSNTVE